MSQREYAEETVFWSLKSAEQFSARRRTTHLYLSSALAKKTKSKQTSFSWIDNTPAVWDELRAVLEEHNPSTIAINADAEISFASGLHAGELRAVQDGLGAKWSDKMVVHPMLAVEYIGTQIDARLPWYRKLQETAWSIIGEAFSERVVVPGVTRTEDVEWWMREQIQALNYTTWFQPSVSILEAGGDPFEGAPQKRAIRHGDVLHVDFGVTALGMNTDTQHVAYVLKPGETEPPKGLRDGLKNANRLQDITRSHMTPGRTGNQILKNIREQMKQEGIEGKIYCHAIGDWGHSAGTVIGMFDEVTQYNKTKD